MLNGLIDWITRVIGDHGFPAILALMTLESACIPVPSEVIQLFAGYLVSIDQMTLFAAVSAGVLGNMLGSWIAYAVGYYGGRPFIERWGRYIHVTPARLTMAERWFDKHGEVTVLVGRCIPVVRTFISLPAGIARMPFWRFTLFTFARLHPLGARPDPDRRPGRPGLGALAPPARVPRLHRGGGDRRRDRVSLRPRATPARRCHRHTLRRRAGHEHQ